MLPSSISKLIPHQTRRSPLRGSRDGLRPWRQWLNHIELHHPTQAHWICQLMPPLCQLNPLYEEVVGLRFRTLCYLAEECAVDVCRY